MPLREFASATRVSLSLAKSRLINYSRECVSIAYTLCQLLPSDRASAPFTRSVLCVCVRVVGNLAGSRLHGARCRIPLATLSRWRKRLTGAFRTYEGR